MSEAPEKQETGKDYTGSWYALTPNRLLATLGALKGEINCDVCVVGGGFTGLSAALELSKKGYSVILLEAKAFADSSPGKNAGHIMRGLVRSPRALESKFDPATARMMCNLTLEGLALVIGRIVKHEIKCDLKFGHVTAAMNRCHASSLKKDIEAWAKIGHTDLKYLDRNEILGFVKSKKYVGGLLDPKGAHIHPLNYALGVVQAAQAAGCKIYDETPVVSMTQGTQVKVETEHGVVNARFVVLGGHIEVPGMVQLKKKVIITKANMIATEPLRERLAHKILPRNSGVADARFIKNYFSLSHDNRLLFGGDGETGVLRQQMVEIFPELASVDVDHAWGSSVDMTLNRLPGFGRMGPNIFYAHGYCGHNIILGNLAGLLIAEVVGGTAERFDVFAKIKHNSLLGSGLLKQPVFALSMAWYRLRDVLF